MQIQEAVKHGVTILRLFGEFDAASAPAVEEKVMESVTGRALCVVLDFQGVPFMSSAGLRVLQKSLNAARQNGGEIRLAAVSAPVSSVLVQTGLAPFFPTFPDVDAALADFAAAAGEAGDPSVVTLSPAGDLDSDSAPELDRMLRDAINAGRTRLVLDFSQVPFVASAGLRVIQSALLSVRGQDGDLRLVALNPHVQKVFDTLGFTPLFKIFDDVPAAVASFR